MSDSFEITSQNKVKRVPDRGLYDHESVFQVIDAAWIGHVAIAGDSDGAPTVIPMLHARIDDCLYFHGANSSRLMKHLASGQPISVSFAMTDGLVLAKSLFHHSMNYRSAVAFGTGERLENRADILAALKAVSDKVMPGRWDDARQPADKELAATMVVRVKIKSASAKIRTGPPIDADEDVSLPVWSGVVPIQSTLGSPITDNHSESSDIPDYIGKFISNRNRSS